MYICQHHSLNSFSLSLPAFTYPFSMSVPPQFSRFHTYTSSPVSVRQIRAGSTQRNDAWVLEKCRYTDFVTLLFPINHLLWKRHCMWGRYTKKQEKFSFPINAYPPPHLGCSDLAPVTLAAAAAAAKSLQSCSTLCDHTDGSPPGSSVPGILQSRTLEWVAISFYNAWKWKVLWPAWPHNWPFPDLSHRKMEGELYSVLFPLADKSRILFTGLGEWSNSLS